MILQLGSNELSTHHSICKAPLKPVPVARGKLGRGGCSPTPRVPPSPQYPGLGRSPKGAAPCPWDTSDRAGLAVPTQGPCSSHPAAVWLCHAQCHCQDLYPVYGYSRTFPGTGRGSSRSWQRPPTPPAGSTARRGPLAPPVRPCPPRLEPHAAAGWVEPACSSLSSAKQVRAPHCLIWEPS